VESKSSTHKQQITLEIVDTGGTDYFLAMQDLDIRFVEFSRRYLLFSHGMGFILVYNITSKATFYHLARIFEQIASIKFEQAPIVLFGNKCDLKNERQVSYTEAQDLANQWNCAFFEGSATDGTSITETFECLSTQILKQKKYQKERKCTIS
jgi:GTPase SAR1 family protein